MCRCSTLACQLSGCNCAGTLVEATRLARARTAVHRVCATGLGIRWGPAGFARTHGKSGVHSQRIQVYKASADEPVSELCSVDQFSELFSAGARAGME